MATYSQAFGMSFCIASPHKIMPKAIPLSTSFFTDILSLTGQAKSGGLAGYKCLKNEDFNHIYIHLKACC
jgi:hypothetical protein